MRRCGARAGRGGGGARGPDRAGARGRPAAEGIHDAHACRAGKETYSREDVIATLGGVIAELGVDPEVIVRLGCQHPPDGAEPLA
jgi:hypothetical protein